ncbi:methyltransferase family protein [Hoeflea sp.]|uniref:methyltransferase family protein n=1 Tax=Hoeflea sp. TaxID=1940281 RepID=UPI003B51B5ED
MNERRTRPNVVPWPPLLIVGLTALAIALQVILPIDPGFSSSRILGAVLIVAALTIDLWAMKTLNDGRTTILPNRGSSHLVTKGPFQFSRNPIYLANLILMVGLGLFFGNGWMLLLAPVDALLTHILAVKREENHLIAMFGFEYEAYCRRVRRWI